MRRYLVFRLDGLMGSMGLQAGNERRGTDRWPARSAIRGLLGAALGVDRHDATGHAELEAGYSLAISLPYGAPGDLLIDFHTVQAVATTTVRRPSSRLAALRKAGGTRNLETVLTRREYHEDCTYDIAVQANDGARWSLEVIRAALLEPRWVLYFGRKACPLAAPVLPHLLTTDNVGSALCEYRSLAAHKVIRNQRCSSRLSVLADPELVPASALSEKRVRRRDAVLQRDGWLFSDRDAVHFDLTEASQ